VKFSTKELHLIIQTHLKPRFVESEIDVGFGFDWLICPICEEKVMAYAEDDPNDFHRKTIIKTSEEIKHKPDCYWSKVHSSKRGR